MNNFLVILRLKYRTHGLFINYKTRDTCETRV